MRLQSAHSNADRAQDAYFTPPEATRALCRIERDHIPYHIWEPACGNGAISKVLEKEAKKSVFSSDVYNYGYGVTGPQWDFLTAPSMLVSFTVGIVTNPPFKLALDFAQKAISLVPYVALLLRTNFLESTSRLAFFRTSPPARIWISSRRLPMMHRLGWTGPEAPSNTCYAWFIWDATATQKRLVDWFDWQDYTEARPALGSDEVEL